MCLILVVMYLAAIVLANLSATYFGPIATIVNAFLFIGLDMTSRDALHEKWRGKLLWPKMFVLIVVGSLLSFLLNRDAGPIAMASTLSFLFAGVADAIMYALLDKKTRVVKINGSNVLSAAVDSIVFPTIAFGSLMPSIVIGQFVAKVLGGFAWSMLIRKRGESA